MNKKKAVKSLNNPKRFSLPNWLIDLTIPAIPYFPLAIMFLGLLIGQPWLFWTGLVLLGLFFICAILFGLVGGVFIPISIFRNWNKYSTAGKIFLGPIAVLLLLGVIVLVVVGVLIFLKGEI